MDPPDSLLHEKRAFFSKTLGTVPATAKTDVSWLVSFDETKENDFNLSLPRHVDLFEEKETINLLAVQAKRPKELSHV